MNIYFGTPVIKLLLAITPMFRYMFKIVSFIKIIALIFCKTLFSPSI